MIKKSSFFLALLFCLQAKSQTDIFSGRWEGKQYIGTHPSKRPPSFGGVQPVALYDSCAVFIDIVHVSDTNYRGTLLQYFYTDPAGSFIKGNFDCSFHNNIFRSGALTNVQSRLLKHSPMFWCESLFATGVVSFERDSLVLRYNPFPSGCITGPSTIYKKIDRTIYTPPPVKEPVAPNTILKKFKERKNKVSSTLEINSGEFSISFYDNGEIDGDSISIFVNNELHTAHVRLTKVPFTITLQPGTEATTIEIAMFAENLGSIPPNTAMMVVKDRSGSRNVYLSSDEKQNAVLRITKPKTRG